MSTSRQHAREGRLRRNFLIRRKNHGDRIQTEPEGSSLEIHGTHHVASFGLVLYLRPRVLHDEPGTGGSQPEIISRINRRRVIPPAPGQRTMPEIRPESRRPRGVDIGQDHQVQVHLTESTPLIRSI